MYLSRIYLFNHICSSRFSDPERSQESPKTFEEKLSDGAVMREIFQRESKRLDLVEEV